MKNCCITVLIACMVLAACARRHRVTYNIPPQYSGAMQAEIKTVCDRGKILYRKHCSECHGIFTKGKDSIPNFSTTQLHKYSAQFMAGDKKNHAVAIKMSSQQLADVLTFLKYKK